MHRVSPDNSFLLNHQQPGTGQKTGIDKNTETIQTIAGTLFIFPVEAMWINREELKKLPYKPEGVGHYAELFFPHEVEVLSLHVWVTNRESRDWSRWIPSKSGKAYRFPLFLPIVYLFNKKEYDRLTIASSEKALNLSLTCCQLTSRYKEYGRFETLVKQKFMAVYNDLCDRRTENRLSKTEELRWKIISQMKQEYYPNSIATKEHRLHRL